MTSSSTTPARARGVVLMSAALIVLMVTAAVGLAHLRVARSRYAPSELEVDRLARAKMGLLGYAASYADQHRSLLGNGVGPGYLPCPDVDFDGSPDPACPREASGHLPWRRLGLDPPTVVTGGPLRYALADRHRSNPHKAQPLNVRHIGRLPRGFAANSVAALWSPDPPAPGSPASRLSGSVSAKTVSRVMTQRALAEARWAIGRFRRASWNPSGEPPRLRGNAAVGPWGQGHLRVHRPGLFPSGFRLRWFRADPSLGRNASHQGPNSARPGAGSVEISVVDGRCLWSRPSRFHCAGRGVGRYSTRPRREFPAEVSLDLSVPRAPATRSEGTANGWYIVVEGVAAGRAEAGLGAVRTRGLRWRGEMMRRGFIRVRLMDTVAGDARFEVGASDSIDVSVQGVSYWLEAGRDIAPWFIEHQWDALVTVAYGPALVTSRCTPHTCVPINGDPGRRWVPGVVAANPLAFGAQTAVRATHSLDISTLGQDSSTWLFQVLQSEIGPQLEPEHESG